jgi:hypothetical protein
MPLASAFAFDVYIDPARFSGIYRIGLHPRWQGRFWTCGLQQSIDVRPAPSAGH